MAAVALAGLLLAIALWTALGHHRYFLAGDASANFAQVCTLRDNYLSANIQALKNRTEAAGSPAHIPLLVEGGFPFFLWLLRLAGERLPFMGNAFLLVMMLGLLAAYIGRLENRPGRRFLAALLGPYLLLVFPATAMLLWDFVLPFRDTLSHTLGLGALLCLPASEAENRAARGRLVLVGLLCGLSAWSRLAGILFAAPAGLHLLVLPGRWRFRRRGEMIFWLGVGCAAGLIPLLMQNVLEGRLFFLPPQSGALLMTDRVGRSGMHAGWHPLNLPSILMPLLHQVLNWFPKWLNGLFLVGAIGWLLSNARPWRVLPPLGGLSAFLLFYACYYRIVWGYAFVIGLFYAVLLALAVAWLADRLLALIARTRLRRAASLTLALVITGQSIYACLRSGPDWTAARQEWVDAVRFKAWMRLHLAPPFSLLTPVQGYQVWRRYFHPTSHSWWADDPRMLREIPASRKPLPGNLNIYSMATLDEEGREQPMWSRDALLNRYDFVPLKKGSRFTGIAAPTFRCYQAQPRAQTNLWCPVQGDGQDATYLFLYLRDLTSTNPIESVEILHPRWHEPLKTAIQAGANLIRLPASPGAGEQTLELRSSIPLPSVVTAQWLRPNEIVHIPLSDYSLVASRALMMEGASIAWRGYWNWWRDWGGHSERHRSTPFFVLTHGNAVRLPLVSSPEAVRMVVRLYYTAFGESERGLRQVIETMYRHNDHLLTPIAVLTSQRYLALDSLAADIIHELEIPLTPGAGSPRLVIQNPDINEKQVLVCHDVSFFVSVPREPEFGRIQPPSAPVILSFEWNPHNEKNWCREGYEPVEWKGEIFRTYVGRMVSRLSACDVLIADGWLGNLCRAYGGPVRSARDLFSPDAAPEKIEQLPARGCSIWVVDLEPAAWTEDGAARRLQPFGALEPIEVLGPAGISWPASDELEQRDVVLYRLTPFSRTEGSRAEK